MKSSKAPASSGTGIAPPPICRRRGSLLASVSVSAKRRRRKRPATSARPARRDDVCGRPEGPPYETTYGAGRRARCTKDYGTSEGSIWTAWSHARAESTTLFYSGRRRDGPPLCAKDGEFFNEGWRPDQTRRPDLIEWIRFLKRFQEVGMEARTPPLEGG